jgi:mannosyltransferase OCH1-like enzyme
MVAKGDRYMIPQKIAQYWDADIPADVEMLCESWRSHHPNFAYTRFSNTEARQFLERKGPSGALQAFDRAREAAMKADVFRLALLYDQGGYYIDADDKCVAPISTIEHADCDLLLYQEDYGTTGNNFIGCAPRHPAIGSALRNAIDSINGGDTDMVWLATGPGLMSRAVAVHLAENLTERLKTTLILERHELARIAAIHIQTAYKQTRKNWHRTTFSRTRSDLIAKLASLLTAQENSRV